MQIWQRHRLNLVTDGDGRRLVEAVCVVMPSDQPIVLNRQLADCAFWLIVITAETRVRYSGRDPRHIAPHRRGQSKRLGHTRTQLIASTRNWAVQAYDIARIGTEGQTRYTRVFSKLGSFSRPWFRR